MRIFVIGLSHKTAPIAVRDRTAIPQDRLISVLNMLKENQGITESVVLSTCNRTELYGVIPKDKESDFDPFAIFDSMYPDEDTSFKEYLFYSKNQDTVKHLFLVSSGLDSLALGEPQIFGQVKAAFQSASDNGNTSAIFNRLFNRTFGVTKCVRTETKIGEGTTSISFAAVEMGQKIFGDLEQLTILIIGAGETGALTASHFKKRGAKKILVTNRTFERAEKLAAQIDGSSIRFEEVEAFLKRVDVVVACIGAEKYTITPEPVEQAMKERKNKALFFLDLGAPRDIDPDIRNIYNVFSYDIDDLKDIVETNIAKRKNAVSAAEEIITEEVREFFEWFNTIGVIPTIQKLQKKFEEIRSEELEQNKNKLKTNDIGQIELLTKSIIKKLLKGPILRLKDISKTSRGLDEVEALKKLFDLDDKN
ncbi:glutamyl-tRNA reductase [candidate division KSB1 bacterium]